LSTCLSVSLYPLLPEYESFLDATPEKGVIIVEYWWQAPNRLHAPKKRGAVPAPHGTKTSMVFFKRILAGDKCWCGSAKTFGKCHRRSDDWTYVSLDPDRRAYSPVILVERIFPQINAAHVRAQLKRDRRLLPIEDAPDRAEWALPAHPPMVNDIGQLVIGTIKIAAHGLYLETNSEKRLEHMTGLVTQLLGAGLGASETRRAEPQKHFAAPGAR